MCFKAPSRISVTFMSLLDVWKKSDNLGGGPKYVHGRRHSPGLNVFRRSVRHGEIDDCLKGTFFFNPFQTRVWGGQLTDGLLCFMTSLTTSCGLSRTGGGCHSDFDI